MTPDSNPFIYSRAVNSEEFLGYELELRRLFGRLRTRQSTAIVGQPHTGKTSLLKNLHNLEAAKTGDGNAKSRNIFSFLDAHTLHNLNNQTEFWKRALFPVTEYLKANRTMTPTSLTSLCNTAEDNGFGTFVLEQLFGGIGEADLQFVLLLDEFDDFLSNPVLNSAEFYGGLRSLASRSTGLVLVIAARRDLEQLNRLTQAINPHGSPYFNVFTEIHLGSITERAMSQLLDRAGALFNRMDREFIVTVSGYHPYLAQAAAAMLWDVHEEAALTGVGRYKAAGMALNRHTRKHFVDTWFSWTNETRKAIAAVALSQIPLLVKGHAFLVSELIDDLDDYLPELETLQESGICVQHSSGQWRITQVAFLWWLADELRRNVRDDSEFKGWLQAQEMEGLFTTKERRRVGKAVSDVLKVMGKGVTTLIESTATGVSKHLISN